jgi:response regulator of citrate/malate metabolism
VKVLIVDDVDEMAKLMETLVSGLPGVRVLGVAPNTWEARRLAQRERPDLVLLDEILPGESSLDLLAEFMAQGVPVLMITGMEEPEHPVPAGAAGRLLKPTWKTLETDRHRIAEAIHKLDRRTRPC